MISGLVARHTIIRKRPTMISDGRGGERADWTGPPDELEIPGWAVDVGNTAEDTQNRAGTLQQQTIQGPYQADVREHDHIVFDGTTYEIDGEPRRQPGPSDLTSHTILLLKRWKG